MDLFIGFPLVFNIFSDDGFIPISPNGTEIETARPDFTISEQFLDLGVMFEFFLQ
jgi:hypothetical protein